MTICPSVDSALSCLIRSVAPDTFHFYMHQGPEQLKQVLMPKRCRSSKINNYTNGRTVVMVNVRFCFFFQKGSTWFS